MDPITANNQQHIIKHAPNANNPIPLRWRRVLEMHLAGYSAITIAENTGYTKYSIYRILDHPNVQSVRQQMMDYMQKEFEGLFEDTVQAVRTGLKDPDPKVRLQAATLWLKSHGKFQDIKITNQVNLTAEDVVLQILQGNKVDLAPKDDAIAVGATINE